MNRYIQSFTKADLAQYLSPRDGEVRCGEMVDGSHRQAAFTDSSATYVILGVPEDIGVQANYGMPGAKAAYEAFLKAFLNLQHNQFLASEQVFIAGQLLVEDLYAGLNTEDIQALRKQTERLDQRLIAVLSEIYQAGKTPILIGGGHNNAYANIKALSGHFQEAVKVLNIDAHTDLRLREGRHSGNGFTYAFKEKALDKYAVLGLNKYYTPQYIYDYLEKHKKHFFYRNLETKLSDSDLSEALSFLGKGFGLEIDLDVIADFPTSAQHPAGMPFSTLRHIIYKAQKQQPAYLHLCEAIADVDDASNRVGKALATLVADFIG
ncbi:MAG: formimidoylglutamase [Flavobacteriaceae bacterium]|nr:formimidoylglutamase [Flavobacteriaceae bacterium]